MVEEKRLNTFKQEIDRNDEVEFSLNPEDVRISTACFTVQQLVLRITNGEILWDTDVQSFSAWRLKHQSWLIESLLLRIPLPVFYVAADESNSWSVIDGVQRLSTINNFVRDEFPLKQLEYFVQLNGKRYSTLPRRIQRRIDETQLVVHIVEVGTPVHVRLDILRRINFRRFNSEKGKDSPHLEP